MNMSMSEYERQRSSSKDEHIDLSMDAIEEIPDDFSADDLAFAHELEGLFDLSREEMPPLFVQTLLEPNDARLQTVEAGFEAKTRARVLRRLNLSRSLARSRTSPWQALRSTMPLHRSFSVIAVITLLVMILSMVYTAPAFAAGMSLLLSGAHSGVMQVHDYPGGLTAAQAQHAQSAGSALSAQSARNISLLQAVQMLHFSMYWPQPDVMPDNYLLDDVYIYKDVDQSWADGPIMELDYDYTFPGVAPQSTGRIAICEFKPMGKVLQVVQLGSAHELKINPNGQASAIYVNGQWTSINKSSHAWQYSGRSELIYEHNGVIFWIVGFQSDGVNSNTLTTIASSLAIFNPTYAMRMRRVLDNVMQSQDTAPLWLDGDVIYLDNPDNPDGPMLKIVSNDNPTNTAPPVVPARHLSKIASLA
jgi:hypothetical protein